MFIFHLIDRLIKFLYQRQRLEGTSPRINWTAHNLEVLVSVLDYACLSFHTAPTPLTALTRIIKTI